MGVLCDVPTASCSIMLYLVIGAVLGTSAPSGCAVPRKSDLQFCGGVVDYAVPNSLDLQTADATAARGAELGSFCSFFIKPAFQCYKNFPECTAGGGPVKLCTSVCKAAFDQQFEACPCEGEESCESQFTVKPSHSGLGNGQGSNHSLYRSRMCVGVLF